MNKKKILAIILIVVCVGCAAFSGMTAYWQYEDAKEASAQFEEISLLVDSTTTETETPEEQPTAEVEETVDEAEAAYLKYSELYNLNHDFIGWISIDGTAINYPVMQTIDNPNYYLKRDFEKTYSDYGVPYIDEKCAVDLSANTVIYGHNMKNGSMFSDLVNYTEKSYFDAQPIITFNTLYGFGKYQIIAAFPFDTNNETFCYNDFADGTEEQFNDYVAQCMARRAYDTGYSAQYGDKLITLSTCEYTHQNGRFVVVAKKLID